MLKSQDVLVAVKLASLALQDARRKQGHTPLPQALMSTMTGWEADPIEVANYENEQLFGPDQSSLEWTYQSLSQRIGISASECNEAVKRGLHCGLLRKSRDNQRPIPSSNALLEFLLHGIKYVFPAEEGVLTRGIPTGFAAPVLSQKLLSSGEHVHVWPDARGKEIGLTLKPIHKSIPLAVKYDSVFYEIFALVDAIRFGKIREVNVATEELNLRMCMI